MTKWSTLLVFKRKSSIDLQIYRRAELPILLKKLKLNGIGGEIGVQNGYFSDKILADSNLSLLYSIDPWIHWEIEEYDKDGANLSQKEQDIIYFNALHLLRKYKARSICLKLKSENAVGLFKDESLDFVYIDAQHSYEKCKQDLELWYPKIKQNGIFSGHDYLTLEQKKLTNRLHYGVKEAVDEFIKDLDCTLYVTKAPLKEEFPSWYFIKK